jgi:hypothetical protein
MGRRRELGPSQHYARLCAPGRCLGNVVELLFLPVIGLRVNTRYYDSVWAREGFYTGLISCSYELASA